MTTYEWSLVLAVLMGIGFIALVILCLLSLWYEISDEEIENDL